MIVVGIHELPILILPIEQALPLIAQRITQSDPFEPVQALHPVKQLLHGQKPLAIGRNIADDLQGCGLAQQSFENQMRDIQRKINDGFDDNHLLARLG